MAAVALDQLALPCDRGAVHVGILGSPCIALDALAVIRLVVAPEDGDSAIAQFPDAGDGSVEERPIVGRHEQRSGSATKVLLEPLHRAEVQVVRRFVEQQQVRIGDHETREGGPRLLAAGQLGGRTEHLVGRETQPGKGLVDALIERVPAEDIEPMLEVRVSGFGDSPVPLEYRQLLRHRFEMGRTMTHGGPNIRRGHEGFIEVRLLSEDAQRQATLAMDGPLVRLVEPGRDPEQRRLARSIWADQPDAIPNGERRLDAVEDHERPDLAGHARQTQDRHQPGPADARARARR